MKFKDTLTGSVLETSNELVIEQFKKHQERYKEVKAKSEAKENKK